MSLRASLTLASCALVWACGGSGSVDGGGGNGGSTAPGGSTSNGGSVSNGGSTSNGGSRAGSGSTAHGGSVSNGGSASGGDTSIGGSSNNGGSASGGDTSIGGNVSNGGTTSGGDTSIGGSSSGGAAGGVSGPPPVFDYLANWPMPNPASAGLPNPSNYDTSTAGVVLDKVTGLIWQAKVSTVAKYNWADANSYCEGLELAGFSDWRLPSRIELVSLIDYTVPDPGPVIDKNAFPDAQNTIFWTASPTAQPPAGSDIWDLRFNDGFPFDDAKTATYNVRCVSSATQIAAPATRYSVANGVVTDNGTGLKWQQTDDGKLYNFADAQTHCASLGTGWRAPSMKELQTLSDETRRLPAIDNSVFPSVNCKSNADPCYNTSTLKAGGQLTWLVCFDEGRATFGGPDELARVLCVQ